MHQGLRCGDSGSGRHRNFERFVPRPQSTQTPHNFLQDFDPPDHTRFINRHMWMDGESFPDVPAEGVRFRLQARDSQRFLYARLAPEPAVGHYLGEERNDQIFTLIHGRHDRKGLCAIKSWTCGNVLFSRYTFSPKVGHIAGDGDYPDNWFEFVRDDRDEASFRIYCPASDSVLYSRAFPEPTFDNYDGDLKYDDQLWRFVLVG